MFLKYIVIVLLLLTTSALAQQPPTHLARSRPLIREFAKLTGYPQGRPGYVVDHEIPLCAGGPDALGNLQWQERRISYLKDAFERELCRDMRRLKLTMVTTDVLQRPR